MVPWKELRGPACGQAGFLNVADGRIDNGDEKRRNNGGVWGSILNNLPQMACFLHEIYFPGF
jgi:hypothetical protein